MVLCLIDQLTNLFLLVQHDMWFETGDAGEPLIANRAGEVWGRVRGSVEREVELHVKRLRALVTSMWLQTREDKLKEVVNDLSVNELRLCNPVLVALNS